MRPCDHGERQQIADAIKSLDTQRFICPRCKGGSTGELSLSVWPRGNGTYGYKCWRSTCNLAPGSILGDGGRIEEVYHDTQPAPRFSGDTFPLPFNVLERWGIETPQRYGILLTGRGSIMIPIRDWRGTRRGEVIRQLPPYDSSEPKARTYKNNNYSGLSWFLPRQSLKPEAIVLVEDQLSAMRVAENGHVGVALLGTLVDAPRLREVREYSSCLPIVLALDSDMRALQMKYVRHFGDRFGMKAVLLSSDIKDMEQSELDELLNRIKEIQS